MPPLAEDRHEPVPGHGFLKEHAVLVLLVGDSLVIRMGYFGEEIERAAHIDFLACLHIEQSKVDRAAAAVARLLRDVASREDFLFLKIRIEVRFHALVEVLDSPKDELPDGAGRTVGVEDLKAVPLRIQFIADDDDNVYVIEVNPRSSRTVPFLSKATSVPMAHIATQVILGHSLKEQGIEEVYPNEKKRWYVKAPAFSFSKLKGMDTYLSPEMKSTGEAIGYDKSLTRALYKAIQASGLNVANYGTVLATIADNDKPTALPLIKRFYDLGFNIEATEGTAKYLKEHGIRTRVRAKLTLDESDEILMALRQGHIAYVINTIDINAGDSHSDGSEIRRAAVENNVTMFTSLDTVKVLLDVLEEITLGVSTIDAE